MQKAPIPCKAVVLQLQTCKVNLSRKLLAASYSFDTNNYSKLCAVHVTAFSCSAFLERSTVLHLLQNWHNCIAEQELPCSKADRNIQSRIGFLYPVFIYAKESGTQSYLPVTLTKLITELTLVIQGESFCFPSFITLIRQLIN